MKTAMNELDEWLTNKWSDPAKLISCSEVSEKIDSLIEKEKEQIINTYLKATYRQTKRINELIISGSSECDFDYISLAKQYYKETYKTDKG